MDNQAISELLGNEVILFLLQIAVFSLPPFYIAILRRPLRTVAFYIYVSIVLVIGGFLGAVYSIPLTESITISGGNLAYGALMYSAVLLVVIEGDVFAIRNVIRLVITINVLKYFLFSIFSWSLSVTTILNPFNTAPDLFAVSVKFVLIGGFLIILELLILLLLLEQIKNRVKNHYIQFSLFVVSFIAVLLLDGMLFPLIAFGVDSSLVSMIVGGITGKFVMAVAYSLPLFGFLLIFRNRLTTYLTTPIVFKEMLSANRGELIEELGRQQKAIRIKEEALRESEERLRLALEASNQGLYDLNLQDGTAEINDQYALMLGYDPETFMETNERWIERLHPDDHERVTKYFQAYVAGEIPEYRVDFRQKVKDGDWIWIASLGKIVAFDSDGEPLRMVGTHLNITDRKVAQARQQRSEARYRALFEYSPVSLWEEDFSEVKQAIDLLKSEGINDFETYLAENQNVLQALANKIKVLDVNQRTLALYNLHDKAQLTGYLEINNPALLHNFQSQMMVVARGEKTVKFTTQASTADGDLLDIVLEWTVQPGHEEDYGRVLVSMVDITAVVKAEQTLAENRHRLQALFDYSQDAILLADDQGQHVDVNPAACELAGYSREEMLQRRVWDISSNGQEPESLGVWQQFIAAGEMGGEFIIQHKDGRIIQTEFSAVANITPGLHLSIMRDITERKQAEIELENSEKKYRNLVETSHDLIWAIDAEARITFMNQASHRIYGRSPEEMIGHYYTDFIPPEQIEANAQSWTDAIENNDRIINFENWVLHKDGTPICLSANAVLFRDEQSNIVGSMGTSQDITERKERERQLQYQALLLANVSEAIISTDLKFNVLTWNQAAEHLYGWKAEDVIGKHLDAIVPIEYPNDDADAVMQQFLQAGAWQGEVIQPNRNGDRRYILSSVTLLRDEADEPVGAVAVNRDITERKAAEERLRELLEQVRLAIDSAQLGLWELDLATNYLQWNDLQLTMYGISREEFETDLDGWRNRVHPEDKDYADGRLGEVFEGHPVFDVPFRVIRPSGEIRHINASATPIFNDAGEIVKLIGINMDVTETHVRENALRESEVRLLQRNQFIETILDNLPIGLAVNNIDKGTATYTNAKFEEIYGWPRKKISDIEQFFQCVYPDPEYRQQIQAQIMDDIASGDPERMSWEEIKITTEHGEKRIVSAKNIPIYNQNFMISTVQDITARSLAEKQIKRTELLLKGMSRIAKIGGWELDLVTMEPYFTEETFHIYELPPTKPPKLEDGISYYPPEYRSLVEKVVQEAIEKKLPYDIEVPFITAKGRHIWVRTQGRVYTEEGKAVRLYGSIQDISERKQAEQKLQVYAQRLETLHQIDRAILAQDSPERIAEVTINHLAQLISCDRISAGLFDETGETATVLAAHVAGATQLGQGMRVSIHDHDGIMSELRQGKTRMFPDLNQFAGRAPTIDALLHDGLRSYMMVPLIAGSRLVGSLSLGSTDTNQFDESHESLVREVADQLAIALHQAYLHKAEKDQRVLAETLQQTAVTLVGSLSLEETLDTILNQLALVVPYDLAQVMLIQDEMLMVGARQGALVKDLLVETERPYTQIPLLYQSLQSGKPFVLTASQIKENHLHLPGMAPELSTWVGIPLIARDIAVGFLTVGQVNAQYLPQEISAVTAFGQQAALAIEKATILLELEKSLNALRETQAHLVRAARLSAIGETAAGVAHQINNPLTTVIIDSHLLLKNLPPSHPARHSADAIHQAALRAANVVERLLDFSRTQPTTKSPTNISDSIKESLTILSAQLPKNIRLEVALPTDLPPVTASPEHLQDVWLNLLLNARDAVMQVDQGIIQVRISHNTTYDKIEVSIQDNGIGMSYTQQQQIFNPFFTTKDRGTGLGLSVCQDIIVHHDGEIRVSSVEGEGSKFTVILPVQPT